MVTNGQKHKLTGRISLVSLEFTLTLYSDPKIY